LATSPRARTLPVAMARTALSRPSQNSWAVSDDCTISTSAEPPSSVEKVGGECLKSNVITEPRSG